MSPLLRGLLLAFAVFAGVTLVAELAGATDLGTAAAFGQIAFMATVVTLMLYARD